MQLTLETESTLDIESMSSIEDIQNKAETLDIEDLNNKICNGNTDIIENTEFENKKQYISEIDEALANIPKEIEDDEPVLSVVRLDEVENEQKAVRTVELEESLNSLENEAYDSNIEKNNVSDKPQDLSEEDYLEDDIISINHEPYAEISKEQDENDVLDKVNTSINNNPLENGERCVENFDKSNASKEIVNPTALQDTDVIEVIEDDEDIVQSHGEKELIEEDKDVIELIEENDNPTTQGEENSLVNVVLQKDEVIGEVKDCLIESERGIEAQEKDCSQSGIEIEKPDAQITNKIRNAEIQTNTKTKDFTESVIPTDDSFISDDENKSLSTAEEVDKKEISESKSPIQEVDVVIANELNEYQTETNTTDLENETIATIGNKKCDGNLTSVETEESPTSSNDSDLNIAAVDKVKDRKNSTTADENDTPLENQDEVEITKDSNQFRLQCTNKITTPIKEVTTNSIQNIETEQNVTTDSSAETELTLCENPEVINTDAIGSPVVAKDDIMDVDEIVKETKKDINIDSPIELKDDMDVEEIGDKIKTSKAIPESKNTPVKSTLINNVIDKPIICKLSNTLDILSDDEEELPKNEDVDSLKIDSTKVPEVDKQCISLEDDDDIMLIDEDTSKNDKSTVNDTNEKNRKAMPVKSHTDRDTETSEKTEKPSFLSEAQTNKEQKELTPPPTAEVTKCNTEIDINEKPDAKIPEPETPIPLVPKNFLKTAQKKISDMTREELEEFCIIKIVESIVDRTSLSDIKNRLKNMSQSLEEFRKKALMLTKQNRDLQVVLKGVQEEQKKSAGDTPITPLKITRSVGMQVFMEKTGPRKKGQLNKNANVAQNRNPNTQGPRPQKPANQNIPVPRLVPAANSPALKSPNTITQITHLTTPTKIINPPNGVSKFTPSPNMKPEKRPHSKIASSSVTVDLTDDEPPSKMPGGPKSSPAPPVRVVPSQNLMAPQRQPFGPGVNSPRKVYIPISGPQNQSLRPGQTIMLKTVPNIRPRGGAPQMTRMEQNAVRMNRVGARHPAPLPLAMKQYQPPNWKSLPPAPDLKLSKVENGIVISWKIEGVSEDSYEEIASYQLYAYQETSSPPSTTLWKKIGDVKALPLPMACTLTQFMAGFKYYFAVRAVDIRSRLGPFSLPGSILLLSKNI